MSGEVVMPLTVAARRLERSLKRLEDVAATGDDAAFEAAHRGWFQDLRRFGGELQRATGLSAAELAERLVS
jgi:hypothetical protein